MIRAADITKIYKIYDKPSDRLKELLLKKPCHREFAALRNISFEVPDGGTLGIIGENGAGKSTLLKIFAGVLRPTYGNLEIKGRIASLLELGTGFHPEFSGIENIYFYGSLLGFTRSEIKNKIDEIVDFSELGDFINMPVKTYSSGMYVRLAFSIAMVVDPDVLIIDEALAVGDLHFQKKSTDRILEFKKDSKNILFCSHSMYHVNLLCDNVIWLKDGAIEKTGEPFNVTSAFESYQRGKDAVVAKRKDKKDRYVQTAISSYIENIEILNGKEIKSGDTLRVKISVKSSEKDMEYGLAVSLRRNDHIVIHTVGSFYDKIIPFKGDKEIIVEYPNIPLLSGIYYFLVYLMDTNLVNIYQDKMSPEVRVSKDSIEPGLCYINHNWVVQ
jgi:ABC-type polysaccharide/polyol phosphate transport system ATPase subunit